MTVLDQTTILFELCHYKLTINITISFAIAQIIDEADKEIVAIHDSEMATSSRDLEVITTPFPSPSAIHQYETPQVGLLSSCCC